MRRIGDEVGRSGVGGMDLHLWYSVHTSDTPAFEGDA